MKVTKTAIEGPLIIEPRVFGDDRGYFFESYNSRAFEVATGINPLFVQDNQSFSTYGVLRGMHFQKPPYAQAKLVSVVQGRVFDVAVDIRKGSPSYGKYAAIELSAENHLRFYIPRGFAHGFVVLSDTALFQYKCDNYYTPQAEGALSWNDPELAIEWPLPLQDVILSDKDKGSISFKDFVSPF